MKFDRQLIEYHTKLLHAAAGIAKVPGGKVVLSVLGEDPDGAEEIFPDVRHFSVGDVEGMVDAAAEFNGVPHRNIYSSLVVLKPDARHGTRREYDVEAVFGFSVDGDADKNNDSPLALPAAYIVETSPGNKQYFYLLDEPLSREEGKRFARAIKRATKADAANVLVQPWRIPGGLNWPNAKKVHERGRSREPQRVRVIQYLEKWTSVEELRKVLEPHFEAPRGEHDAVAPALDNVPYADLHWWLDYKIEKQWRDDPESPFCDQGEFVKIGKEIKLNFPNEDGLALFMKLASTKQDKYEKRWWNEDDFRPEWQEGFSTLHGRLKRDVVWMFRSIVVDGKTLMGTDPLPFVSATIEIPAEILERMSAEREQQMAAALGPMPGHSELPMYQAEGLAKYWAHIPSGRMIKELTGEFCAAGSIDKHLGKIKDAMNANGPGKLASTWLSQHRCVDAVGWGPGEEKIIPNKVLTKDGWIPSPGEKTFNLYIPSFVEHIEGDVSRWIDHIKFVYPGEAEHIVRYLAHRVQRPAEKINHCLSFIGPQGTGKDTIVHPVIVAIGAHNFKEITAKEFYGSEWNDYLQSVLLRINEIHDLGGESKYGFYDASKVVITNPPATHRINTKHVPQYSAVNVNGTVMTSNHPDALYIPPDDRRHYVCLTTRTKEDFREGYFDSLYRWFDCEGGNEAVAHHLSNLDLIVYNPKATPPKTAGWHMVVTAGVAPETGELNDIIESLGTPLGDGKFDKPKALTIGQIKAKAMTTPGSELRSIFDDAKLRKAIPKRLADCGYSVVVNPETRNSGGRWRIRGIGKTTIYAKQELSDIERCTEAQMLVAKLTPPRQEP